MQDGDRFTFYVGTRYPRWMWDGTSRHPLFLSVRRLNRYKKLHRSHVPWCLDSGGFTELSIHGKWVTSPEEYVDSTRRMAEMGMMQWASPQDWMCEPQMLAKTGLTVEQHQHLTCVNLLDLRSLAPDLPFIPVLQGWLPEDYLVHVEMYAQYGVDLRAEPVVGLGSFCRRANVRGVRELVIELAGDGLKLHGFGLKRDGLRLFRDYLVSSDSMAWSFAGRAAGWKGIYLCGKRHQSAKSCKDCLDWAMMWADEVAQTKQETQPTLWECV